jgi:hypothetical protein
MEKFRKVLPFLPSPSFFLLFLLSSCFRYFFSSPIHPYSNNNFIGDKIVSAQFNKVYDVVEVGILHPENRPTDALYVKEGREKKEERMHKERNKRRTKKLKNAEK